MDLNQSLTLLFAELINGAPPGDAYMLNPGDPGLLRSLDSLSAAAASQRGATGGATIAAHVEHVCYGFQLLNRWADGDPNPWATADWTQAWKRTAVTDEEWAALRTRFRDTVQQWHRELQTPRELAPIELNGVIGSLAHLAYHFGAIRQIDRSLHGPKATDPPPAHA